MAEDASIAGQPAAVQGLGGVAADWSGDKQAFPVPWGKVMMWIFLLSDTFIFSCFLTSYMNVRMSTTATWPDPSKVFELEIFGHPVPLLLIAIMTMVLITSSGTMALAVNYGYRRDRARTTALMLATAAWARVSSACKPSSGTSSSLRKVCGLGAIPWALRSSVRRFS